MNKMNIIIAMFLKFFSSIQDEGCVILNAVLVLFAKVM